MSDRPGEETLSVLREREGYSPPSLGEGWGKARRDLEGEGRSNEQQKEERL